jgi:outer membrane protein assembly factor BamB
VVYEGRLYVQVDNEESSFLVALDSKTGEEVWRVDRDEKTNYSTPYLWKNRSRTELVVGGKTARSYDPETGELLWKLKVPGYYNIPSAVGDKDYLYLGNTTRRDVKGSLFCVRAGSDGDITPDSGEVNSRGVVWANYDAPLNNPSPLLHKGLLYLVSGRGGQVSCFNAFNGNMVYKEKIEGVAAVWASPWTEGEHIYFTDDKGATHVFKAGKKFEYLHANSLEDKFWTTMAFARDAYILKGTDRLYCVGN